MRLIRGERNGGTKNSGKNNSGKTTAGRKAAGKGLREDYGGRLPPLFFPLQFFPLLSFPPLFLPLPFLPPPYFPRNAICPFRVASMLIPRIRPASPGAWKPIEFSASTKSA